MADWLGFSIDKAWLEENIRWKDFGTGVRLGRAFMPHSHPGGEAYLVLEGEVWDEDGTYPAGSIVWMNRETTHTPKTRGKTLILVLWPEGVKTA